jgi:NAD(P)-dependent dehydrogenase (short-subunit alcohol dehydrogenase family)
MKAHRGSVAIVTGAASGIGLAIAGRLAAEGARVVLADRDGPAAAAAAAGLDGAEVAALDVTDEAATEALVRDVARRHGRLDIMVNNAGIMVVAPVVRTSAEDWRRLMEVNVTGVFLGARAAARVMIPQGRGVIVNTASGAGRRGVANLSAYCASKAAVISLTQTLAIELAPHGIRVNATAPGNIETPFWGPIAAGFAREMGVTPAEAIARFRAGVPMGRFGTPAEVAAAVSWLASDEAAYVSGQTIAMNGADLPW